MHTGATIAEYYRDMGHDVGLFVDSMSRWAEAMLDLSGRLGEVPGDHGYPTSLGSRVARYFQRGGVCTAIGSPVRQGSLSIVGTLSPPSGDLSDPMVSAALAASQVFWAMDPRLARRKHFPTLNWTQSHTRCMDSLAPYFAKLEPEFCGIRDRALHVLHEEAQLEDLVSVMGRDALTEPQKVVLAIARMLREDFLQQNVFASYDFTCPLVKSVAMLKCIMHLHEVCMAAVTRAEGPVTWTAIKAHMPGTLLRISQLYFLSPRLPETDVRASCNRVEAEITDAMSALLEATSA